MRLELRTVTVKSAEFGATTQVAAGRLTVARDELRELLAQDKRLTEIEIDIANPGDDCRIAGLFDVFEPRCKPDGRSNFPGLTDSIARAGNGTTVALRGAAVMVVNGMPERSSTVVDMSGPGAKLTPYGSTANVCIRSRPAAGLDRAAYYRAQKEAGARAAEYLAQAASKADGQTVEIFDLGPAAARPANLPRVAYIYTIASQQRPTELDEPVLYGDNVRNLLPTVVHPNEVLDGAVIAPYWNFGAETYSIQNHPMVTELYRRHGTDFIFAGVVAIVAAENEKQRRRNATMAATLAREILSADALVITKYGGGIPESVAMETYDACVELGMKGVIVIWTHGGDGKIEGSLTFMSPRADAVVSCGITDQTVELPAVACVIGAATIGPVLTTDRGSEVFQSMGAMRLTQQLIAGAINQLGGNRLSIEEY